MTRGSAPQWYYGAVCFSLCTKPVLHWTYLSKVSHYTNNEKAAGTRQGVPTKTRKKTASRLTWKLKEMLDSKSFENWALSMFYEGHISETQSWATESKPNFSVFIEKKTPLYKFIKMWFLSYFHHNTNSLFKHGQNPIQVSLLLQQTGLTDPVFGKLLGQRWQPCQNCLHLVRRAPLQTPEELKKDHLDTPVKAHL